jgi:2-dehydro-3-deoxy-D-gluconate 5-dehydrogenase
VSVQDDTRLPGGFLARTFGLARLTAVVTGARRGIGRATALALADAGADVVLWGRTPRGLDEVAEQVRERGRTAAVVTADLADPGQARRVAAAVAAEFQVDLLVNNAAVNRRGLATELAFADWRAVLATRSPGPRVLTSKSGGGEMKAGKLRWMPATWPGTVTARCAAMREPQSPPWAPYRS